MSDEKPSSNLSMNDYFFEINFLLKLEVKLVSAILNIILTIFRKKKYYFSWSIFSCYLLEALMSGALRGARSMSCDGMRLGSFLITIALRAEASGSRRA